MDTKGNQRKSEELGMPFGTACHQLRKSVMFHLLQKHGENVCYRCSRVIETVDDLTIEHKQTWLGVDVKLFWDLNNIAFSHAKCNRRDPGRKVGPDGTAWCRMCQSFVDVSLFYKNAKRWNGLEPKCSVCDYERTKRNRTQLAQRPERQKDESLGVVGTQQDTGSCGSIPQPGGADRCFDGFGDYQV